MILSESELNPAGETVTVTVTDSTMCAAFSGHTDCARLLIDAGADKDAKTHVRVGLYFAGVPPVFLSHFVLYLVTCALYISPPFLLYPVLSYFEWPMSYFFRVSLPFVSLYCYLSSHTILGFILVHLTS